MTIHGGVLSRLTIIRGRLTGISIAEAELRDVAWRDSAADMAAFRHARMTRVTFDACSLRESDFMGARCDRIRFHDCDLTGATFSHAQFADSEFRRCRMDGIEGVDGLRGASMDMEQVLALAPALAGALGIRLLAE